MSLQSGDWIKRKKGTVKWVVDYIVGDEINIVRYDPYDTRNKIRKVLKQSVFDRHWEKTKVF